VLLKSTDIRYLSNKSAHKLKNCALEKYRYLSNKSAHNLRNYALEKYRYLSNKITRLSMAL
jgi:hypothetical protein